MRLFFRSDFRSLHLLNATQFLGALNDNIFKLLVIYLVINLQGSQHANLVLAIAGGVFVIPFLLFSSGAGVLADRISKRSILVYMKVAEVVIMCLSIGAIYWQSPIACYSLLFLMATQSAIFGPSKYGIIPELVDSRNVSNANGLLTSFTYLAIILGTFLASFLTDVTDKNFTLATFFCVVIAILGLVTSIGIAKTPPKGTKKKINPFFLYELYQSYKISYQYEHLLTAIFGSAFFLFIGGFTQLNMIPFGIQSLGLSEVGGGYLFLATAIGIAIGSVFAGKVSKDKVEIGLSCISAFCLSFLFILLYFFAAHLYVIIVLLILIGFAGGVLLVPFDAFIQVESPDNQRGRIIAASNFSSFVGILLASIFIYLIGAKLALTAAAGFLVMGILTFCFSIFITGRFAPLFFPFFVQRFLLRRYALQILSPPPEKPSVLVYQNGSWVDVLMLFSIIKKLRIITLGTIKNFPFFNGLFNNIIKIRPTPNREETLTKVLKKAEELHEKERTICIFLDSDYTCEEIKKNYQVIFKKPPVNLHFVKAKRTSIQKVFFSTSFRKKQISISFEDK